MFIYKDSDITTIKNGIYVCWKYCFIL